MVVEIDTMYFMAFRNYLTDLRSRVKGHCFFIGSVSLHSML